MHGTTGQHRAALHVPITTAAHPNAMAVQKDSFSCAHLQCDS